MGHSEMLLAVAGLENEEVQNIVTNLASGNWQDYSPAQRQAFWWAYQLSRHPDQLDSAAREDLFRTYGRASGLDLIWNIAWCNYMTRFADAFQLPLEQKNVFADKE